MLGGSRLESGRIVICAMGRRFDRQTGWGGENVSHKCVISWIRERDHQLGS